MATGARPGTLRKTCRHCALAKRRCSVDLPRCLRCSKKGLDCSYDLEPLTTAAAVTQPPPWKGTEAVSDTAAHCLLERASRLDSGHFGCPKIPVNEERVGIEYVLWALSLMPTLVTQGKPSAFIHPKLRPLSDESHLTLAVDALRQVQVISPQHQSFLDLLLIDPSDGPIDDALGAVQALMLYMMAFIFGGAKTVPGAAESHFTRLSGWTGVLESRAGHTTTQGKAPWQGWLLGESIRRTILVSHIFICCFFRDAYEVPEAKIRMEALPFDSRVGLWQAESPQAWIAAARVKKGEDVRTELVSWHEFSTSRQSIPMDAGADMFFSMLFVAHNGRQA